MSTDPTPYGPTDEGPTLPRYQPPVPKGSPPPAKQGTGSTSPEMRAMARKQLQAKSDFRKHLICYLAVMALLICIWAVTMPLHYFWPMWPAMGWGLGLVLHGASLTWDRPPTEEQIDAEAKRLEKKGWSGGTLEQGPHPPEDH